MSLRSKTQKAKKFGTPSAPSPSATPKAPSPRATGGTPSAPSPSAAPKAPSPRSYGITQTAPGQTVQEQFKTKLQTITAPIRNTINKLTDRAQALEKEGTGRSPDLGALQSAKIVRQEIANQEKMLKEIELQEHNLELQNNVNQIIQALESGNVVAPDYFQNNIVWVKSGAITQQAFLDSYYYLANQGIIHTAPTEPAIIEEPIIEIPELLPEVEAQLEPIPIITPTVDESINTNMVTQQVINFNIVL